MIRPSPRSHGRLAAGAWIVALSLVPTALNAVKPLHMDDTVYHSYATQIAARPGDPYGGEIVDYWAPPRSGMDVLAPVFLPYAWSRVMLVHGDHLGLAKLWLAPIELMLVGAVWMLARRFARGFEVPVAAMAAFSPAILPSLNVMLDVPTLALGLAGLAVFIGACDRGSVARAIVAGGLAGLAINTKWTGFLAPAAMGLYALSHRRIGLGVAAVLVAAGVFVGWEAWIAHVYGRSHFLLHSERKQTSLMDRVNGARALVAILGGVAPAVLVLGLVALRRRVLAVVVAVGVVVGFAMVAVGVSPQAVFLTMGALLLVNLATIATVLLRRRGRSYGRSLFRGDPDSLFLVLWLAMEVVGFFALSPYSAVRRVLGIVVVATLLAGRLASRTCRSEPRRLAVRLVALGGMTLGLGYFAVDLWEARVERAAAEDSAREALALVEPGHTAYYVGRWGFRHYAAQAGLTHLAPGRTELKPGDVLVVHDNKIPMEPAVTIDGALAEEVVTLRYQDALPLRTVPPFYAGKEPLQRQVGPRFVARIYRVVSPFVPLGWIPPRFGPQDRPVGALMGPPGVK